MRPWGAFIAVLGLLGGCTSLIQSLNPVYVPQPIHIYDKIRYAADVKDCLEAGKRYVSGLFVGSIATNTVEGATNNLSLAPINPLGPAYGALGGAVGAVTRGFNIVSANQLNVARNCLIAETSFDHSALIADPRD